MNDYDTDHDENGFGWFGWFSAAGFIVLGLLYLLETTDVAAWPLSATVTGALALLAGIGAVLLYYGNDPTRRERRERTA